RSTPRTASTVPPRVLYVRARSCVAIIVVPSFEGAVMLTSCVVCPMLSTALLALFSNMGHYLRSADSYRHSSRMSSHDSRQCRLGDPRPATRQHPWFVLCPDSRNPIRLVRIGRRDARPPNRHRRNHLVQDVEA